MSREIKFRGLTLDGEWMYTSQNWMLNPIGHFMYNPGKGDGATVVSLKEGTIGEFTGLVDVSGRRVYEGDVVICDSADWVVEWFDTGFTLRCVCHHPSGDFYRLYKSDDLQVLGNIHEDSELLETAQ